MSETPYRHAHAVILAGGDGTRFWPLSRKDKPKQFLALTGGDTMLQATVARIAPLVPTERVLVVTAAAHAALVRRQLPEVLSENILAEPVGRNTAAAVAWAGEIVRARDPDGVMVVLAADHHILNPDVFRAAVGWAVAAANEERALILYGLTPDGPKTQYGYIVPRRDRQAVSSAKPRLYPVERFHEKPSEDAAREYLAAGCFWNGGMFTWRADVMLGELARCAPEVLEALGSALAVRSDREQFASAYGAIPSISIDHALLERSERRFVVESGIERVDLGTWATIAALWDADEDGNVNLGEVVTLGSRNTIHHASGKLVATIGLENMIVVAANDIVLVCDRARAAEVSAIVRRLREQNLAKWL